MSYYRITEWHDKDNDIMQRLIAVSRLTAMKIITSPVGHNTPYRSGSFLQ